MNACMRVKIACSGPNKYSEGTFCSSIGCSNCPSLRKDSGKVGLYVYNMMKGGNKAQFSTRLGGVLTKLKDNSTVQVAHEQARAVFAQFPLRDIFTAFVSKMDTIELTSQKEKKEVGRLYITFVDAYKMQLLADQYYQKMLESLGRKAVGVSEVLAHICKTLLSRIQDQLQLFPFVSLILSIFHTHPELPKIIKQVAQTVNPSVVAALQGDMMTALGDKLGAAKAKGEFLDAVLSLILCLQERLEVETQIVALLMKYIRHQEWSCRKNCVDIAYALLVINQKIAEPVHLAVKQLKYDKIKHVRDSVNNYDKLHQQLFGKETPQKQMPQPSIRQAKIKSDYSNKKIARSPAPIQKEEVKKQIREQKIEKEKVMEEEKEKEKSSSLDKSMKAKQKNENFFKNAKNSDVIRITQTTAPDMKKQDPADEPSMTLTHSLYLPRQDQTSGKNFEAYLRDRSAPTFKEQIQPVFEKVAAPQRESEVMKALGKFETLKSQQKAKFNYENELQNFRKKQKVGQVQAVRLEGRENLSISEEQAEKSHPEFSISYISNKQENTLLQDFRSLLLTFERRINDRLDRMETRIQNLQRNSGANGSIASISSQLEKGKTFELGVSQLQESPRSILYNSSPFDSKSSYTDREGVQSNLEQKVRISIANENWDQAFTIALTNNHKNVLLNLLERCVFPVDRTVEECIILQVRKLLGYVSALKWLKHYLTQRQPSSDRLLKLREDLRRRPLTDNRNYQMLRQMLLNDIHEKLSEPQMFQSSQ